MHKFFEKLFVPADVGVQLVVGPLDGLGVLEAGLGKGAREQGDGGIDGENPFWVWSHGRRGPDGETVGDGPVLDDLHQVLLFQGVQGGRECDFGGRCHDQGSVVYESLTCLGLVLVSRVLSVEVEMKGFVPWTSQLFLVDWSAVYDSKADQG